MRSIVNKIYIIKCRKEKGYEGYECGGFGED